MIRKAFRKNFINKAHDLIFNKIHSNRLIYNACWEDPKIDRQLLKLDNNSEIVMLTSAGCNALDYLLDEPKIIHAVDVNPRQNALLDLKLRMIENINYEDFFAMFGLGAAECFREYYAQVSDKLSRFAEAYWRRKIKYFDSKSKRGSFYFYGTSGNIAWFFKKYLRLQVELKELINKIIDSQSLEEQQRIFEQIEPKLWNVIICWFLKHPLFMANLGVPRPQMELILKQHEGNLADYIKTNVRNVATKIAIKDNYFWRVYVTGSYTHDCCPEYLKEENFIKLRKLSNRVKLYNSTILEFLKQNPGRYTHYVLLDHQDWLAWHDPHALTEEWRAILDNSIVGTLILMRSAGIRVDFLPGEIKSRLRFSPEITEKLHTQDRVGTYGGVFLAEVIR